jgi:hypothetical protein
VFNFGTAERAEFVQSSGYRLVSAFNFSCTWTGFAKQQQFCQQTGLPLEEIFESLLDAGFTFEDIAQLENCGKERHKVIEYVRSWIVRLQSEQAQSTATQASAQIVSVRVGE